jgi:membrane protein YqaA with SNARE-associated domain
VQNLIVEYGLMGLFVSAFVSSTIAPGGSEAALIYLLMEDEFSQANLLTAATLGNTLGALTTWYLGALTARGYSVEKVFHGKHERAISLVRGWGPIILVFSWLPVIGDAFCFAAGWLRLPFTISLLMIALGKLARYAFIVYIFG